MENRNLSMGEMLTYIMQRFGTNCIKSCADCPQTQSFELVFTVNGKRKRIEYRDLDAYEEWMKSICEKPLEG